MLCTREFEACSSTFVLSFEEGTRSEIVSPGLISLAWLGRYLVPEEVTVGQFVHIVGKRLKLQSGQALFVFVGNVLPPTG